jgi:exonuclease I
MSIFPHEQQTAKGFVKEITFVTASTNCNFLGYSVKFDDEITCKECW